MNISESQSAVEHRVNSRHQRPTCGSECVCSPGKSAELHGGGGGGGGGGGWMFPQSWCCCLHSEVEAEHHESCCRPNTAAIPPVCVRPSVPLHADGCQRLHRTTPGEPVRVPGGRRWWCWPQVGGYDTAALLLHNTRRKAPPSGQQPPAGVKNKLIMFPLAECTSISDGGSTQVLK